MQKSKKLQLRFVVVFLVTLAIALPICNAINKNIYRRTKERVTYIEENVINGIESIYARYMIAVKSMEGLISNRPNNYMGLEMMAEGYQKNIAGITSLQVSHDGETVFCFPADSADTGPNLFAPDQKRSDIMQAKDQKVSVLSGPYDKKGGGSCLVLCTPVYLRTPDAASKDGFWGFASAVIDLRQFFNSAGLKRLNDMGYSYQLWTRDRTDTLIFDGILGDFETPLSRNFKMGNKDWILYVEPAEGWVSRGTMTMCITGSFLAALILALLELLGNNIAQSNLRLKKQARQLRESEENERNLRNIYEASVESAELFLWELNLSDGSARLINNPFTRSASEAHGIPKEFPSLINFVRNYCIEEDAKVLDDLFSDVRRGEKNISAMIHFRSPVDMQVHTLKISYLIISDEYGRPVKAYGAAQDFTEACAKQDSYNQERAFFTSYQGLDMMLRVRIDLTTDRILEAKPYDKSLTGANYTEKTQNGKGMNFIIDGDKTAGEVLNRERMLQQFAAGNRSFTYEYSIGKIGSQLSWARGIARLLECPDNKHVELFFYAYDISEQKNEQLLMGRIINSVYERIGIVDLPDGNFRNFMVKKELVDDSGMPYDEYIQSIVAPRYIPEADQAAFREGMKLETVMQELDSHGQYLFTTPQLEMAEGGGAARKVYKMIRFCYLDDQHTGIIVCISDVTIQSEKEMAQREKLKDALSKAESASKAKSEFVSRISHDIRTPIGAIQNLTQFAKRDAEDKDKLLHDLDQIETSNKFLLSLINDVLDISKVDKGQIKLIPEVYPYQEYIDNIRNIMEPMCANKGLHWQLNASKDGFGGAAVIDRIRINQIALNLLSNAVKYTPECGDITYNSKSRIKEDGRFLFAFEVQDNGIGMSDDFQKHMFEEFSQEYDNNNRPKGITGTGLGLAIVKRMVDLMGGRLMVESKLGVGTKINVEIPCQFQTDSQIMEAEKKEAAVEQDNESAEVKLPGKVLLAEDNPINVEIAMTILDIFGCKVEHAENGKEAVEMFAFSKPGEYSVILMDIQMPFMDGYEATSRIRGLKREDAKTIPIIAMTADAFEDARQKAYDAGVDDYLTKPLNPKELKRRLLDVM